MMSFTPTQRSYKALSILTALTALGMILSPSGILDMLFLGTLIIVLAHTFIGERLLLIFLALSLVQI